MTTISKAQIVRWLEQSAAVLQENREYLTELDAAIGDADHGTNMSRGFGKVAERLPGVADKDIGNLLKAVGMTLISTVGGASGPLYGTAFMRMGTAVMAREELTGEELAAMLAEGMAGIVQRGRAVVGDKTMIDVWTPAVAAINAAVAEGKSAAEALGAGVKSAETGLQSTIPMQARKGRASYLGERSIGHQDPGGTSTLMLLNALYAVVSSPQ